jgi:hypothetical protein
MKGTMPKLDIIHVPDNLKLKAVILCDELDFAANAAAMLHRVRSSAGADVNWTVECWPVNAFDEAAFAERAVIEALDAFLIVVPSRHVQYPKFFLLEWLRRWAALRHVHEAALGIMTERDAAPVEFPIHPELSALVKWHGLTLISSSSPYSPDPGNVLIHFTGERQMLLPVEQRHFVYAEARWSYRGFGINE